MMGHKLCIRHSVEKIFSLLENLIHIQLFLAIGVIFEDSLT